MVKPFMICLILAFCLSAPFSILEAQGQNMSNSLYEEIEEAVDRLTGIDDTDSYVQLKYSSDWYFELEALQLRYVEVYFQKGKPIRSLVFFRGRIENSSIPSAKEFFMRVGLRNEDPRIIFISRPTLNKYADRTVLTLVREKFYNENYGGGGCLNLSLVGELFKELEFSIQDGKVRLCSSHFIQFAEQ